MAYQEKLISNFIKGLELIRNCNMRDTNGKEVHRYKIGKEEYTETFIDCCVVDCDKETFKKWLIINRMFNEEYKKDAAIGEMLENEFKKLDKYIKNILKGV